MSNKLFRFLKATNPNTVMLALTDDISTTLRLSQVSFAPKDKALLPVYQDSITMNKQIDVSDPDCGPCNKKYQTLSVGVTFSGPIASKADKLAMLAELAAAVADGQYAAQLEGFPSNGNTTFTVAEASA